MRDESRIVFNALLSFVARGTTAIVGILLVVAFVALNLLIARLLRPKLRVEGDKLDIEFDKAGSKKVVAKFVMAADDIPF